MSQLFQPIIPAQTSSKQVIKPVALKRGNQLLLIYLVSSFLTALLLLQTASQSDGAALNEVMKYRSSKDRGEYSDTFLKNLA